MYREPTERRSGFPEGVAEQEQLVSTLNSRVSRSFLQTP